MRLSDSPSPSPLNSKKENAKAVPPKGEGLKPVEWKIKVPVIGPLPQTLWWQRFLRALNEGKTEEAEVILEHANLVVLSQHSVSNHDE